MKTQFRTPIRYFCEIDANDDRGFRATLIVMDYVQKVNHCSIIEIDRYRLEHVSKDRDAMFAELKLWQHIKNEYRLTFDVARDMGLTVNVEKWL